MSFIEMNHIRKQFGNLEVLKDVTLHMERGEVISIIGPSGSGKSTFCGVSVSLKPSIEEKSSSMDSTWSRRRKAASAPSTNRLPVYGPSAAAWAWYSSISTFSPT